MRLEEIYHADKPVISFEVFPPKGGVQDTEKLFQNLRVLAKYKPGLISVTYGAGGASRDFSLDVVSRIKNELDIIPMPHFTCVGNDCAFIEDYLCRIEQMGIENILALRGDLPKDGCGFCSDFKYASDLIKFIREKTSLSIAAAAYPEGHMECACRDIDIENLRRKVDEGVSVLFTQLFFDNDFYYSFLDRLEKAQIDIPVVPGILPVSDYGQLKKMTAMCGSKVPKKLEEYFATFADDRDGIIKAGTDYAVRQVRGLIDAGVPGLHFYTLNKSQQVSALLDSVL